MDARPGPPQQGLQRDNPGASEFAQGVQASIIGIQLAPDSARSGSHAAISARWSPYNPTPSSESQQLDYFSHRTAGLTNQQDAWNPLQATGVPAQPTAFIPPYNKPYQAAEVEGRYPNCQYSPSPEYGGKHDFFQPDSGYGGSRKGASSVSTSCGVNSSFGSSSNEYEHGEHLAGFEQNTGQCSDEFPDGIHMSEPLSLLQDLRCDYPGCKWKGKCPSDKKKHEARHRKLFRCDTPNCTRKDGFGTLNDLARHKKCVHEQDPERGPKIVYMCFADNCPRRNKKWPRLDNFRQHLNRMHGDECADELVKRSRDWYEKVVKPQQSIPSVVDRFSQAEMKYEMQPLLDSEVAMPRNEQEACDSIIPGQDMIPTEISRSSESLTLNPIKSFPVEDTTPEWKGFSNDRALPYSHSFNLPSLMSLNLPVSAGQGSPTPQGNGRNAYVDGYATVMAGKIIKEMTNFMNGSQPRRGQTSDSRKGASGQRYGDLPISKKDMMQKILWTALGQLGGNPESNLRFRDERSKPEPATKGRIQCDFCEKRTRLPSEMRKHVKWHERPYGCTFAKCSNTMGSKSDWKRHENEHHFQLECWRCDLPDLSGEEDRPCAQLFDRQYLYVEHLETAHEVSCREKVQASVSTNRIGRNGMGPYWCGFCCKILPITRHGFGRANERFDHIDFEHIKKGERIENWVLEYGHLTKRQETEREEQKREERERLKLAAASAAARGSGGEGIGSPGLEVDPAARNRPASRSKQEPNQRKRKSPTAHDSSNQYVLGSTSRTKKLSKTKSSPRANTIPGVSEPFHQPVEGQGQPEEMEGDSAGKDALFQPQDFVLCCMDGEYYHKLTTVQCIKCHHELCGNCEPKGSPSAEESG